jgi:hypothetical protein
MDAAILDVNDDMLLETAAAARGLLNIVIYCDAFLKTV